MQKLFGEKIAHPILLPTHQVQKYVPAILDKYKPLPLSTEALFEKDVAKLVSNKLPGSKVG